MQVEVNNILSNINPNTIAVFWITKNELSENLQYFNHFNYLFNSLISEYLKENATISKSKSHVFLTKNFNSKLWLVHLNGTNLSSEIKESISLFKNESILRLEILVLNETEKKWEDELPQIYNDFIFKKIN